MTAALPVEWLGRTIEQHGLWTGLVATFVAGLALNLTPCVYPMIPVTIAFFSGQASGSVRRTLLLASLYVVGISASYAALGLFAARTGALMGTLLQRPPVLLVTALVLVALSLSMFGLYELRVPHALLQRFGRASSGFAGALIMGLLVGLVAAPCVGPFVLGLLVFTSHLGDPKAGFLLFFTLGLGMGTPYLFLGLAADRIGHMPKAGAWLVWVKRALGVVLLGLALYTVKPLIGPRPVGGAASGVAWVPYTDAAFERAQREHRPIVIDVYADWCLPCIELDHATFRDPDVVKALDSVAALRVDATLEVAPAIERLLEHYEVFGVPTVLLFDASGTEHADLRVVGFVEPEEFLKRMSAIR